MSQISEDIKNNENTTFFKKKELISEKQLEQMMDRFPDFAQRSLNLCKQGKLDFVTNDEIDNLREIYLSKSKTQYKNESNDGSSFLSEHQRSPDTGVSCDGIKRLKG